MIRATSRLQLHRGFTFADAATQVPYYAALGISHLYLSPIFKARPGSTHGYDTLDYSLVNPELGGERGLRRLAAAARAAGMGLVVDIVPNHMAADTRNPWWRDVLRHGAQSHYARYFDIDWSAPADTARHRILLPLLGAPLAELLERGELKRKGRTLRYHDQEFPLSGRLAGTLGEILERQPYRLAHWSEASRAINWRRFFEVSSLVGLCVERPEVFEAAHARLFELYREGLIDGVRVDHVDGLADPRAYCQRLRRELERRRPGRAWIVVEKILGIDEKLPRDWGCDGTTGYDFLAEANLLLHAPSGERSLTQLWRDMSGSTRNYSEELRAARLLMARRNFAGETRALARRFQNHPLLAASGSADHLRTHRALCALLAAFPVYRLYTGGGDAPLLAARCAAARRLGGPSARLLSRMVRALRADDPPSRALRGRFFQLTPALVAKAGEDTAFYRYGRLLSLSEVGGDPARFSMSVAEFHRRCRGRADAAPQSLLSTATHDHKRGEDARARLAVLSEQPELWRRKVRWLRTHNRRHRNDKMLHPTDEYLLYQSLLGSWPYDRDSGDYEYRIAAWQEKALREAKLRSDWLAVDADYEKACREFLRRILSDADFVNCMADLVERIAPAGAVNSFTQTLLRLTVPGVPDLYQGTELWDFSLVDPDNRCPVDYPRRTAALESLRTMAELLPEWHTGRPKQALIAAALRLRARLPEVFARGSYRALPVAGDGAQRVLAFERRHLGVSVVVVAALRSARFIVNMQPHVNPDSWKNTVIALPRGCYWNVLDPKSRPSSEIVTILAKLPVALLVSSDSGTPTLLPE